MLALNSDGRSALELLDRGWHLRFAIGAAAVTATLFTFAISREPVMPTPAFADRWNVVPRDSLLSKPIRTLSFVPPAPVNPRYRRSTVSCNRRCRRPRCRRSHPWRLISQKSR